MRTTTAVSPVLLPSRVACMATTDVLFGPPPSAPELSPLFDSVTTIAVSYATDKDTGRTLAPIVGKPDTDVVCGSPRDRHRGLNRDRTEARRADGLLNGHRRRPGSKQSIEISGGCLFNADVAWHNARDFMRNDNPDDYACPPPCSDKEVEFGDRLKNRVDFWRGIGALLFFLL